MAWAILTRDYEGGVDICGIIFNSVEDAEEHTLTLVDTGEFDDVWFEYVTLSGFEGDSQ